MVVLMMKTRGFIMNEGYLDINEGFWDEGVKV